MKTYVPVYAIRLNTVINITAIDSIHYFEFDKNFQFPGEKHNSWEMVYVDSGQVIVTADDKKHRLRQGEVIFHKLNEFYAVNADKKTSSNEIITLLQTNIYGKITVEEICKTLNYSKTYISKVFNETTGQTIISYYTDLKINEAKKLIREHIYSFTEISNMLYFSDPHYFSRVFKKGTNMSPVNT